MFLVRKIELVEMQVGLVNLEVVHWISFLHFFDTIFGKGELMPFFFLLYLILPFFP
jgi:hypothetical protein